DPAAARQVLVDAGFRVGEGLVVETDEPAGVTQALGTAGIWLTELTPVRRDLESVFLELTAGTQMGVAE
ncbi:ABC transporter ATP-binding protein, partial [Nocardioides hankookensis]